MSGSSDGVVTFSLPDRVWETNVPVSSQCFKVNCLTSTETLSLAMIWCREGLSLLRITIGLLTLLTRFYLVNKTWGTAMAALLTNEQRLQVYFLEPTFDACICEQFNRSCNLNVWGLYRAAHSHLIMETLAMFLLCVASYNALLFPDLLYRTCYPSVPYILQWVCTF